MVLHKSAQNPNLGQLHKSQDERDGIEILLRSLFSEGRVKITIYVADAAATVISDIKVMLTTPHF